MSRPKADFSIVVLKTLYVTEKRSGVETARLLGIGRTTLSRYLKELGIPERNLSEALRHRHLSPAHRAKVIKNLKYQT